MNNLKSHIEPLLDMISSLQEHKTASNSIKVYFNCTKSHLKQVGFVEFAFKKYNHLQE